MSIDIIARLTEILHSGADPNTKVGAVSRLAEELEEAAKKPVPTAKAKDDYVHIDVEHADHAGKGNVRVKPR